MYALQGAISRRASFPLRATDTTALADGVATRAAREAEHAVTSRALVASKSSAIDSHAGAGGTCGVHPDSTLKPYRQEVAGRGVDG